MTPIVVIRSLSGYINRIQAIVSARLLAEDLGAQLWVVWEESAVVPVSMSAVFPQEFCQSHQKTSTDVMTEFGVDVRKIDPYLSTNRAGSVVSLAGLDRGEQAFMPELRSAIAKNNDLQAVVISAGGKFVLNGDSRLTTNQERDFRSRRHGVYLTMELHPYIERRASDLASTHGRFMALHLRYSDRSLESPWRRQIRPAIQQVAQAQGLTSVFLASDSPKQRDDWANTTSRLGLDPWWCEVGETDRSDPASAADALIDWRILTKSDGMVYFAASSFAEEAAVASGAFDESMGLRASCVRQSWMRSREYAMAAVSYPRRHGWWQR